MTTSGEREFLDTETLPMTEVNDEDPVIESEDEYGVLDDDPPGVPAPVEPDDQNVVPDDRDSDVEAEDA